MNDSLVSSIEKQEVFNRIGYGDAENISARIDSLVNDYIDNYHEFIMPSFSCEYKDIGEASDTRVRIDGITFKSGVLTHLLGECEYAAVFVLTIGGYLEELVTHLSTKGMMLQATILDSIGSGAVEKLASEIVAEIKREVAEDGLVISRRFSPGYCDWEVTQQKSLFELLGGNTAGVILTENMLMTPRKSISGIIGIGLPGRDIEKFNPCLTCQKKDCPGRRR